MVTIPQHFSLGLLALCAAEVTCVWLIVSRPWKRLGRRRSLSPRMRDLTRLYAYGLRLPHPRVVALDFNGTKHADYMLKLLVSGLANGAPIPPYGSA